MYVLVAVTISSQEVWSFLYFLPIYLILCIADNIQAVDHSASSSVSQLDNYSINDCTPHCIIYGEALGDKARKCTISCHYQANRRRCIASEVTIANEQCK